MALKRTLSNYQLPECTMSFSIGTSGSNMGPRSALQSFGEEAKGRAFDRRIIVRLLGFVYPYWRRMAVALVLTLIAAVLTLATPYLVKVAIDRYIAQGDAAGLGRIALLTAG